MHRDRRSRSRVHQTNRHDRARSVQSPMKGRDDSFCFNLKRRIIDPPLDFNPTIVITRDVSRYNSCDGGLRLIHLSQN